MEFCNTEVTEINREECIGNSRETINENFQALDTSLCVLSSAIYSGSIFSDARFLSGAVSVRNIGTEGVELYKEGTQRPFEFRKLASGSGNVFIQEDEDSQAIKISVLQTSAINVGTGEGIIIGDYPTYPIPVRTLKAGSNVDINTTGNEITISVEAAVSAANIGSGEGQIFESINNNNLQFKTIKAGAGVVVTDGSDYVQIDATGVGGGEANTASNLGTEDDGSGVFAEKNGVDLRFKRIKAGEGINLTETPESIVIDSSGEGGSGITRAVNIGISTPPPVGVFKNIAGSTLRLKSVAAGYNIEVSEANDTVVVSSPKTISKAIDVPGSTGEASLLPEPPIVDRTLHTKKIRAGKDIVITNGPKDVIVSMPYMVGMVAPFPCRKAPEGWLSLEGQLISRNTYNRLWEVAQDSENIVQDAAWVSAGTYGSFSYGDNIDTFRLPDMRGCFVRGWDNGRTLDNGRGIGTYQVDGFKTHGHSGATDVRGDHRHTFSQTASIPTNSVGGQPEKLLHENTTQGVVNNWSANMNPAGNHSHSVTVNINTDGGIYETRPKNIALLYCIKY